MARLLRSLVLFLLCISSLKKIYCEDEKLQVEQNVDKTKSISNAEVDESHVLVLTSENFDEILQKHPVFLVNFYAPWCEICKGLVPSFAEAAKELAQDDPPIVLAKVDGSVEKELTNRLEVFGYPSVIFFKNKKDYIYDGLGSKEGIVEYMRKIAQPDWKPEPPAVVTLTKDNFDDVVNRKKFFLVDFYKPRCDQCKKRSIMYKKAAEELKKDQPPVLLAKVNAAEDPELAIKYGITSFPTLKVFRNGRAVDFKGELDSHYDIIYYTKRYKGEGAREISDAKILKYLFVPDEISVVGFFDSRDNPKSYPYIDLSVLIRDDFNFGIVFDDYLRQLYNIKPNSVVVFTGERFHTKYEPKWYSLEIKDDTTSDDIMDFLKDHHLPLVGQYAHSLVNHYDKKRPLCLVFYSVDFSFDHKEATQLWRHKIADVAVKFPDITFAIADDEEHTSILQQFGLDESGEEINIGLHGADGKKYCMEPMSEFNEKTVIEFLNKYKQGKLKPYVKSQRPPKQQKGPLTVVVGDTFDQIVKDSSKDVLIELYSPWCEPCKQLESKLETLAKKFKEDSNLVLAKMDATANDLPGNYSATNYPTIYFAATNNKETPLKYEGKREVDDIEEFLRQHAVVSFGKTDKDEL